MLLFKIFALNFVNCVIAKDIFGTFSKSLITSNINCTFDYDCGFNGHCKQINSTSGLCFCNKGQYTLVTNDLCGYTQVPTLMAFLVSFFVGGCGIDRCILARGNGCFTCLGILKGITLGGLGIWWLVDVILIGCNQLVDGNGIPLSGW